MDLTFSDAEESFRRELQAWLGANLPAGWGTEAFPEPQSLAEEVAFLVDWQRQLHSGGWVGVHWPRAYGGRGATTVENYVLQEEFARAQAPEIIGRIGVEHIASVRPAAVGGNEPPADAGVGAEFCDDLGHAGTHDLGTFQRGFAVRLQRAELSFPAVPEVRAQR